MSHICRTCLEEINDNNRLNLDNDENNVKTQLSECVPELDLDLIPNAYLCVYCARVLQNSYEFKLKCLQSEEVIREHMKERILPDLDIIKSDFRPHSDLFNVESLHTGMEVVYIHEDRDEDDVESFLDNKAIIIQPSNVTPSPPNNVKSTATLSRIKSEEQKLYTHVTYSSKKIDHTFDCTKCDFKTTRSFLLKQHSTTHDDNKSCSKPTTVLVTRNGIKEYVCDRCPFKTKKKLRYHKHKRSHNDPNFLCKICLFNASSKTALRNHLRGHDNLKITIKVPNTLTEDPYKCLKCSYTATGLKKLKKHQKTHKVSTADNNVVYKCTTCKYETNNNSLLQEHKAIHTKRRDDPKVSQCPECPITLKYQSKLKFHLKHHTGNRQFKCHLCTYNVSTASNLKKHLVFH
ncbi:hypothetical protein RI129_012770 [Pyrocoelia pectoralis]|uniref:C2H2-type domain-containing protein n=1 Tax=Pyrocoelia pectoralis TaxID=417401 RepID=A0AAN7UUB4_9COLE